MKKLYALLIVLILFVVPSCFALNTASNLYPELECVHGNMNYTIPAGVTLSEIAQHYRQRMAVIADVQSNGITDLNRIYAGKTMIIPCTINYAATRSVSIRKTAKVVSASTKLHGYVYGKFIPDTTPKETVELDTIVTDQSLIAPTPIAILPLTDRPFVETPDNTTVAVASTQPEQAPITPPRSRSKKAKKVTGYRLMLTSAEAKANGLVLNHDLDTRVVVFKSERDKMNGTISRELRNLHSRAKLKGKNVVLSISLKQMPDQPFIVLVEGTRQPIDGDSMVANAEPFQGRFPGPSRFRRIMVPGSKMLLETTVVTLMSGGNLPLGIGIGMGVPIARSFARRHLNTIQNNAEFEFRETALILQPTEIAVLNPQD